jgi:hypothetical protein
MAWNQCIKKRASGAPKALKAQISFFFARVSHKSVRVEVFLFFSLRNQNDVVLIGLVLKPLGQFLSFSRIQPPIPDSSPPEPSQTKKISNLNPQIVSNLLEPICFLHYSDLKKAVRGTLSLWALGGRNY